MTASKLSGAISAAPPKRGSNAKGILPMSELMLTPEPLGFAFAGAAFSLVALLALDQQQYHARNWQPALAEVISHAQKCDMHNISTTGVFTGDSIIDCAEVGDFRRSHQIGRWHSDRVTILTIQFDASGETVQTEVLQRQISSGEVRNGDSLRINFDPDNPKRVDRPLTRFDRILFYVCQLIGAFMMIAGYVGHRRQKDDDSWTLGQWNDHFKAE
jgi:hypothetical protein